MTTRLSKSRYLSGLQCLKRLYLDIHAREVASEFDAGTRVGELARERYPGGVLVEVDYFQVADGLARTAAALADPGAPVISESSGTLLPNIPECNWRTFALVSSAGLDQKTSVGCQRDEGDGRESR